MRPPVQRAVSSAFAAGRPQAFVCGSCRRQAVSAPKLVLPLQTQRYASGSDRGSQFRDKLRRKIWATDRPPGQRDPYKQMTPEEKAQELAELEEEASAKAPTDDMTEAEFEQMAEENYVPAEDISQLDSLYGEVEPFDQRFSFQGFMPRGRLEDLLIEPAVRRAVIEVLTFQEAGRPPLDATLAPAASTLDFGRIELDAQSLKFESEALREEILAAASAESNNTETSNSNEFVTVDSQTATERPWHGVAIDNEELKFAILKRVMQLTGRRIPDHAVTQFNTAGDIVKELTKKAKPEKLADELLQQPNIIALPNVEISTRRRTETDRETEVGRLKVIEAELERKGLPPFADGQKRRRRFIVA